MKKFIAIAIIITLLFSSLTFTLSGCNKEETLKTNVYEAPAPTSSDDGDIFSEREAISDGLGNYDFGGRKFRIITHKPADFFVEEGERNQGNLIADAMFNRNAAVENRFNCEIEITYSSDYSAVKAWATKSIMSGADEFDLFASHCCLLALF